MLIFFKNIFFCFRVRLFTNRCSGSSDSSSTAGLLRSFLTMMSLSSDRSIMPRFSFRPSFFIFESYLRPIGELFAGFNFNAEVLRLAKESRSSCNFSLERKIIELSDSSDDELVGLKVGELPECLFRSITDIWIVKLSKVSPALFEISDMFPYICSVTVGDEVSQTLLDRLPDVLPRLASFRYGPTFFRNKMISFEFVARFKSLNFFCACNRLTSIDEFKLILQNCKVLGNATFFKRKHKHESFFLFIKLIGKPEERIYNLFWRKFGHLDRRIVDSARTSFDHEELLYHLEAFGLGVEATFCLFEAG